MNLLYLNEYTITKKKSTNYTSNNLPNMKKQCSFRLLMMGDVSPETC